MTNSFHTDTFAKIPNEKRERILNAAMTVFGRDGVSGARMAEIAKLAAISHGSLFSYFPTKDNLVRALIEQGILLQRNLFGGLDLGSTFALNLESLLKKAWETAEKYSNLISLWLSLSQNENARFADSIFSLEEEASSLWASLIDSGYAEGSIDRDLDRHFVAFIIDAAVAQILKSRTSALERKKFAGLYGESGDAPESLARSLVRTLSPRS